jgi:gas vesicle protein
MNDRMKVLVAGVGGAVVGSLAGYLLLTRRGEALRNDLLPQLEEFLGRVKELQSSLVQARSVAAESWQTLQDLTQGGEVGTSRTH